MICFTLLEKIIPLPYVVQQLCSSRDFKVSVFLVLYTVEYSCSGSQWVLVCCALPFRVFLVRRFEGGRAGGCVGERLRGQHFAVCVRARLGRFDQHHIQAECVAPCRLRIPLICPPVLPLPLLLLSCAAEHVPDRHSSRLPPLPLPPLPLRLDSLFDVH